MARLTRRHRWMLGDGVASQSSAAGAVSCVVLQEGEELLITPCTALGKILDGEGATSLSQQPGLQSGRPVGGFELLVRQSLVHRFVTLDVVLDAVRCVEVDRLERTHERPPGR